MVLPEVMGSDVRHSINSARVHDMVETAVAQQGGLGDKEVEEAFLDH
jgi:hypothetical protein